MPSVERIVYVVDDDHHVRRGLSELLASYGISVKTFSSASEYVAFNRADLTACLLLDLQLPDIHGLELQCKLADTDGPPIIFITGHGDIPSGVRAIKNGAIEFLTKPVDQEQLLAALEIAFIKDEQNRLNRIEETSLRKRWASLTPREAEVFRLVVTGLLNKQSASELGIMENTFQVHRGRVMKKMKADSLADLVRMSTKLELSRGISEKIATERYPCFQDVTLASA